MMARIRHIAIATQDLEATVRFYKEGLGLTEVGKTDSPLAQGYYLTDGYINLAVLQFRDDAAATTEGAPRYAGIHHFGLQVDDMEEARKQIEQAGATPRPMGTAMDATVEQRQANVEVKFLGPDGVTVDLSEHGWMGATG